MTTTWGEMVMEPLTWSHAEHPTPPEANIKYTGPPRAHREHLSNAEIINQLFNHFRGFPLAPCGAPPEKTGVAAAPGAQ